MAIQYGMLNSFYLRKRYTYHGAVVAGAGIKELIPDFKLSAIYQGWQAFLKRHFLFGFDSEEP